jgi:hypothetical protein
MIITNTESFPTGHITINGIPTNASRPKATGMLFFNDDGIECGGFIYGGSKNENGHTQIVHLSFDQYDGDQVLVLSMQDIKQGDERVVVGGLILSDRSATESMLTILQEQKEWEKLSPEELKSKFKEYEEQGVWSRGAPRALLGKDGALDNNNGLFLFDDKGTPRAMFYVDKENNAKLEFLDENGNIIATFPE